MKKSVTYIFDKYDNDVDLHVNDRTNVHTIARNKYESVAKFAEMLARELDRMENNATLYVKIEL